MPIVLWTYEAILSATKDTRTALEDDLARLGLFSGEAQGLNGPITTLEKFLTAKNHTILMFYRDNIAVAFLKFGQKSLYLYDPRGRIINLEVDCVLDFFCVTEERRKGIGMQLFQTMLSTLNLEPCKLAYDRPSPLLVSFMKKHFDLPAPEVQPNRYALFNGFWD